jgi:hypothetical protein
MLFLYLVVMIAGYIMIVLGFSDFTLKKNHGKTGRAPLMSAVMFIFGIVLTFGSILLFFVPDFFD